MSFVLRDTVATDARFVASASRGTPERTVVLASFGVGANFGSALPGVEVLPDRHAEAGHAALLCRDPWARPISDQGRRPECVQNALCDAAEITSGEGVDYSRAFAAFETMVQQGRRGAEIVNGSSPRAAVSAMRRVGLCREDLCPYDAVRGEQPDPEAYADAERRLRWWEVARAGGWDDVLEALGMRGASLVPMRNSWGPLWCDRGSCVVGESFVEACWDLWVIRYVGPRA